MTDEKTSTPVKPSADYFDDTDVSENLGGNIVRGSAFVFVSSILKFLIGIGATAILARLLDPEDYGLLAMVFVVTNFLLLFRDMNLSLATVQKDKITHDQVSTIYWINVGICCVVALLFLLVAPVIAWAYEEPRLAGIASLLALPVLIRGFSSQHQALLRRKMRFGALTAIDVASMLGGYAVAIILALHDFGYWSLVWFHIGVAVTYCVMNWVVSGWCPRLPVRGSGVRGMLAFGTNLTGYSIVRYVSRSVDNAIIGWYWGPAALGIYSRSKTLLGPISNYLSAPIGAVAIPSLSRLTSDVERYDRTFFRLAEKVSLVVLPATLLLIATATDVVAIVLGPKWTEAGPILAILSIIVFTESVSGCLNWIFISQGRGKDMLRFGMFAGLVRIVAVIFGIQWGIIGVAAALSIAMLFIYFPAQVWYCCRGISIRQSQIYMMLYPALLASITGFVIVLTIRSLFSFDNPAVSFSISCVIMAAIQVLFLLFTHQGRRTLGDIRKGLTILFRQPIKKT